MAASQPVYDAQGDLLGVLAVDVFLSHLSRFLKTLEIGRHGQAFIIEPSGLVIASTAKEKPFLQEEQGSQTRRLQAAELGNPSIRAAAQALNQRFDTLQAVQEPQDLSFEHAGQTHFLQLTPLQHASGLEWLIAVVVPEADFMARITANNRLTLLLILITLLSAVFLGVFMARKIANPIHSLQTTAENLALEDWTQDKVQGSRIVETDALIRSFQRMAGRLQHTLTSLQAEVERREQAEEKLQNRLQHEKALALCSRDLLKGGMEAISSVLKRLIAATRVGRVYIFENFEDAMDGLCTRQIHEAVAEGIPQEIDNPDLKHLPYKSGGLERWTERLARGQHVAGLVRTFPQSERAILAPQGIDSILIIPIQVKGHWWGFIGFDEVRSEREWSQEEIRLLRVAAELIGHHVEQQLAAEALRKREAQYRTLAESPNSIVMHFDSQGVILFVNQYAANLFGYTAEEMLGKKSTDLIHPDIHTNGRKADAFFEDLLLHPELYQRNENENLTRDGRSLWISWTNTPTYDAEGRMSGLISTGIDITERKRMEAQLLQSQKHEALGTLTGGIAHDFNNILAIILGYTEIAEMQTPEANPARQALEEVKSASLRARDIVSQLLTFTRKEQQEHKIFDIRPIVKEGLKMLRSTLPASIEFQSRIPEEPLPVKADETQIHQTLINLCTNAAQAMEGIGVLDVRLEGIVFDTTEPVVDQHLEPGEYVMLSVRDSGLGIEQKDLQRIFDLYFTTKATGKGTGLGLSVVLGILKAHNGGITVSSERGKGTTFAVFLPLSREKQTHQNMAPVLNTPLGSEHILLVDDEQSIVSLNQQRLERLGYTVTGISDPKEALERIKEDSDRFDPVLTDMTMPGMTGDQLARKILDIRPGMPIILCTGYSERITTNSAEKLGLAKYLKKPLDMQTLADALREVLDGI